VQTIAGADKNRLVRVLAETPLYARSIFAHKTHKGNRLIIPEKGFLYDIYTEKSRDIAIIKSTQTGISEYLVGRSIWRAGGGKNVLYILPTYELKNQFVRERFDKTIMNSALFQNEINEEKRLADSTSLKQFRKGSIVFTGSNSAVGFISHPCDDIIVDELDNCNQYNIVMARERQSASVDKTTVKVSNPTVTNYGIHQEYLESTKGEWHIKHDACGKWIVPDFFDHVVRKIDDNVYIVRDKQWERDSGKQLRPICSCGKTFDRYSHGQWVHAYLKKSKKGYHVSKMFSTYVTLDEMFSTFEKGLSNETVMQRFYNGDLGFPYVSSGAKLDTVIINECIDESYNMPLSCKNPCIAGIDVGSVFHVVISDLSEGKVVFIGTLPVNDISEVKELFQRYSVKLFVIDALPETRIVRQIIARNKTGFMSYYGSAKNELTINRNDNIISSNRTISLDAVKESFVLKSLILPVNSRTIPDFFDQMTCSTRVYDAEKNVFDWVEVGDDHYFHAYCYMLLAKKLLVMAQ